MAKPTSKNDRQARPRPLPSTEEKTAPVPRREANTGRFVQSGTPTTRGPAKRPSSGVGSQAEHPNYSDLSSFTSSSKAKSESSGVLKVGDPVGEVHAFGASNAEPALARWESNSLEGSAEVGSTGKATLRDDTLSATATVGPRASIDIVHPTNDDPWSETVDDRLGVEDDARAFARLAVARAFRPPLAVGVFGAWGAGKSFFMRLIYEHVERLKKGEPTVDAPEADKQVFHEGVVQIRFNAWHYAETNLWASLVDHIFTELGGALKASPNVSSPLDRLGTARDLTLEAAHELVARRREQSRAADALRLAKERYAEAQQNVGTEASIYWRAFDAVFNDPANAAVQQSKSDLRVAAAELGVANLEREAGRTLEAWESLVKESRRGQLIGRGLLERLGSGRLVAILCLLIFLGPFAGAAAINLLAQWLPSMAAVKGWVITATTTLASFTGVLGWALTQVRDALSKLEKAKAAVDQEVERRMSEFKQEELRRRAELDAAATKVSEATAIFEASTRRLAQASDEFFGSSASGRLIRFVRARATDGHYAAHLGLIASIRKDFEMLSKELEGASKEAPMQDPGMTGFAYEVRRLVCENFHALTHRDRRALLELTVPPPKEEAPFHRIVLYIDDLDRCPPDKVVEVLQAVHMLLAFKLFVVFVAVDVRWVAQALKKQYPELLSEGRADPTGQAGPTDYLEKIFQVPYWLPEVDEARAVPYLRSLFPGVHGPTAQLDSLDEREESVVPVSAKEFELTEAELQELEAFVPYVGASPRKVIRFVNVYRLIKASGIFAAQEQDLQVAERALLLQLALATAAPDEFSKWSTAVCRQDHSFGLVDLEQVLTTMQSDGEIKDGRYVSGLRKFHAQLATDEHAHGLRLLQKYVSVARRYSFAR